MKITRITNWYKYKDKYSNDIKKVARFNNDNNQQLLIFINENNKLSYSINPSIIKSSYKLISDNPTQISPELEKSALDYIYTKFMSAYTISDNQKI